MLTIAILGYTLFPILIIILFQRYAFFQKIGTVILAYAVGISIALTDIFNSPDNTAEIKPIQDLLMNISVPLAIPLMLFSCNFKLWTQSLPKTFAALISGLIAIVIAVIAGFFLFRNSGIENLNNISALMTGLYTGGTMNFAAIGKALNIDSNTLTVSLTLEMVITFPFILFLIAGGYRVFRKLLPFSNEATSTAVTKVDLDNGNFENYGGILHKNNFLKIIIALSISILFLAVGAGLSLLITGKLNELIVILTITTLGILASFNKKIRELPKTFELGMFFILIFSIVVASQFNIEHINAAVFNIFWFIVFILITSLAIHFVLCRIMKVNGDLFTVAIVGMLCSPPFIPPIVGAMKNKKVLISGIVIGLIGYAVGTYLGVIMSIILPS